MKTIKLSEIGNRPLFQGDIMLTVVAANESKNAKVNKSNIVAHSETGHHHVAEKGTVFNLDPMTMFLKPNGKGFIDGIPYVDIVHKRPFDTHETYRLFFDIPDVVVRIDRQEEYTPDGWRRVED